MTTKRQKYEVTNPSGGQRCSACGCPLPDDWPRTTVKADPTAKNPLLLTYLWCDPCRRLNT